MFFSPDANACTSTASSNSSHHQSTSYQLLSTSSSSSSVEVLAHLFSPPGNGVSASKQLKIGGWLLTQQRCVILWVLLCIFLRELLSLTKNNSLDDKLSTVQQNIMSDMDRKFDEKFASFLSVMKDMLGKQPFKGIFCHSLSNRIVFYINSIKLLKFRLDVRFNRMAEITLGTEDKAV